MASCRVRGDGARQHGGEDFRTGTCIDSLCGSNRSGQNSSLYPCVEFKLAYPKESKEFKRLYLAISQPTN